MKPKLSAAHEQIIESLKKYSLENKIPIKRARYIISFIHRFPRPFNTRIINELCKIKAIKPNGSSGDLEILV